MSFRSAHEVAVRSIVLYAVVGAGHNESRSKIVSWLETEGLWHHASPDEQAFLEATEPSQRQVNTTDGLMPALAQWGVTNLGVIRRTVWPSA